MFNKQKDANNDFKQDVTNLMIADESQFRDFPQAPMAEQDESISKWEIDTQAEVAVVELTLMGYKKTIDGWKSVSQPLINQEGLYSLLAPIKSLANKITSLTILDEETIRIDCLAFRKDTAYKIVVNRKRWGIKRSNRKSLILLLDTLMNCMLNKAKNALLVRARREQVQVKELKVQGHDNRGRQFKNF